MALASVGNAADVSEGLAPARREAVLLLSDALSKHGLAVLSAPRGRGARATVRRSLANLAEHQIQWLDGDVAHAGYLAGFEPFLLDLWQWSQDHRPDLLTKSEQSLKRMWPQRSSAAFLIPKDLTNTSIQEERTRFYHYEYQNKLLVGLAEFALAVTAAMDQRVALVIEDADRLPPTSRSLLTTLRRLQASDRRIQVVMLDRSGRNDLHVSAPVIALSPLSEAEFNEAVGVPDMSSEQKAQLFARSGGDPELGTALAKFGRRLDATILLTAETLLDLELASITPDRRLELAQDFVANGCRGDVLARRNAETFPRQAMDAENGVAHAAAMARYRQGAGPLVICYALAIADPAKRLEALVEPFEILMGIGLYDTWFAIFAPLYADPELRTAGSGDDPVNGLFINAAFVLYAMGYASAALPFLTQFLDRFPNSRFVPTALYAQSMTYGRYQIPVDLPRAEACAKKNLDVIDAQFSNHERYTYIRVFAENAYAYIKARQMNFAEALSLCEEGVDKIVKIYGIEHFNLHRSILIYNTSQIYEIVGDFARAEQRLKEAIDCDPYYAEYHNDLGNLLSRANGREAEAEMAYAQAIALSPPYYEAHLNRGLLLAEQGRLDSAQADFRRALQIKPSEWRALRELGNIELARGKPGRALAYYDAALNYEHRDADLHANAGVAAAEAGDRGGAMRRYRFAIALNPKHADAHNNLAAELIQAGRLAEALEHARAAVDIAENPTHARNLAEIERLRRLSKGRDAC